VFAVDTNSRSPGVFRIRSKPLYEHFRGLRAGCQNKSIPRHLMDATPATRRRLFDALMAGNGSFKTKSGCTSALYTTTSKGLADDVQELSLRIRLGASVYAAKEADPANNTRKAWSVGIFPNRSNASIGEQSRSTARFYSRDYDDTVYCATVPAGLLIVRRNGKVLVTGNSDGTPAGANAEADSSKKIGILECNALLNRLSIAKCLRPA